MPITKVSLQNVGPHASLTRTLGNNLIWLVGPNGSGKSTFVNSIYATFTNDFSRLGEKKENAIRNDSDPAEESYCEVEGYHDSEHYTIRRHLRPNKAKLTIVSDGVVQNYAKSNDIADAIQSRLGVSKAILDQYVFVNQWMMFQFLDQTPSDRAKAYMQLCGITKAEGIAKICNDFVSKEESVKIIDNRDEIEADIARYKARHKQYKEDYSSHFPDVLSKSDLTAMKDIVQQAKTRKQLREKAEEQSNTLKDRKKRLRQQEKALASKAQDYEDALADPSILEDDSVQAHKDIVRQYREWQKVKTRRESLLARKEKAEATLQQLEPPSPPSDVDQKDEVTDEVATLRSTNASVEYALESIRAARGSECSTCLQQIDESHAPRLQKVLEENGQKLKELRSRLAAINSYLKAVGEFKEETTRKEAEISKVDAQLATLSEVTTEAVSAEDYETSKSAISLSEEATEAAKQAERELRRAESAIATPRAEIASASSTLSELKKELRDLPRVQGAKDASRRLLAHTAAVNARRVAKECIETTREDLGRLQKSFRRLQSRINEHGKTSEVLNVVRDVADVFHWKNLPRQVSQSNLELLVSSINKKLELFDNPFSVKAGDNLTFMVYFPGRPATPATALSGGQKVVLALAFRLAMDSMFSREVGMLFLDEPTAGLDRENIRYFHDAIEQLANNIGDNKQVVISTHDLDGTPAVGEVIAFGPTA